MQQHSCASIETAPPFVQPHGIDVPLLTDAHIGAAQVIQNRVPAFDTPAVLCAVWNLTNCKLRTNLTGHTGYINSVTVSPDGSLCASGGKDGTAQLWDLSEGKHLYELDAGDIINCLLFSPNRYWLCAATEKCIKIWDLESKAVVDELRPEFPPMGKRALEPRCVSLAWSGDGQTLFSGYTDCIIRVWQVMSGVGGVMG